ncbi:hypothetical protein Tco_0164203 [Tanacetum coccineum]
MDSNDTKIPMDPGTKLVKAEDGNSVDATYYRSLIGSLRYLLHTRPDLSYSVGLLSRFMQDPKDHHLKAIKQVIRYIKGTKEHGIIYKKEGGCKITGYSDSSYGKQSTVALSSCESEFMTATGAACQAFWFKTVLVKLRVGRAGINIEENGHINVEHVSGELQRADILTKALPRLKFVTMQKMLGVQDLGSSNDQD